MIHPHHPVLTPLREDVARFERVLNDLPADHELARAMVQADLTRAQRKLGDMLGLMS